MQIDGKSQSIDQCGRHALVVGQAFVERDHTESGGMACGQTVTLEGDFLRVQHGRQPRCGGRRQTLGHGQHHDATIRQRQYALLRDGVPSLQRGGEIEPAQQAFVVDVQRYPPHWGALGQQVTQAMQPAIARRAGQCPDHNPAGADRVHCKQRSGVQCGDRERWLRATPA